MDGAAVLYANDSVLEELGLTAKGDLFALRAFCQKKSSGKPAEKDTLKKKLLEQMFSKRQRKVLLLEPDLILVRKKMLKRGKFFLAGYIINLIKESM